MDDLSGKHFAWLWRGLLLLFVPVLVAMRWIDSGLQASGAAHGIVSFEFCAFSRPLKNYCARLCRVENRLGLLIYNS